jgi:hypothetical protein
VNTKAKRGTPWQIDFLNVGLFFGQSKVLNKTADLRPEDEKKNGSHVANMPRLLSGCLPDPRKQCEILKLFLSIHKKEIRDETIVNSSLNKCFELGRRRRSQITRNVFLPISRGGMGVLPPLGWKLRIKQVQRYLAYKISPMGYDYDIQFPLYGTMIVEKDPFVFTPFMKLLADESARDEISGSLSSIRCKYFDCFFNIILYRRFNEDHSDDFSLIVLRKMLTVVLPRFNLNKCTIDVPCI